MALVAEKSMCVAGFLYLFVDCWLFFANFPLIFWSHVVYEGSPTYPRSRGGGEGYLDTVASKNAIQHELCFSHSNLDPVLYVYAIFSELFRGSITS